MIANGIETVLKNLPLILFLGGVICALLFHRAMHWPQRWLSWMLLAVGVELVWGGVFHLFFPGIASAQIGWQPSPFEFEVGVGDMAMGLVAMAAFWRSASFQSAIALTVTLFFAGVSVGHFVQAFGHDNFSADNFGVLLGLTLVRVVLFPILLWAVWRGSGIRLPFPENRLQL